MFDRNLCELRGKHFVADNYFSKSVVEIPVDPDRQLMKMLSLRKKDMYYFYQYDNMNTFA